MGVEVELQDKEQDNAVDVGSLPAADGAPVAETHDLHAPSSPPLLPSDPSLLPGDAASKRQRRPNVRLNEIGSESSLANVVEYLLKRKGGRSPGMVGAKRGRKARTEKDNPPAATANTPGKLSKMPKILPKVKSDDDDDDDDDDDHEDDDVLHDAEDSQPRTSKPFEEQLSPMGGGRRRKVRGLGGSGFPDHNMGPVITKRVKRPKSALSHPPEEGNGNNWMHKAMAGVADGFLEAADGGVYGCSDTDKHPHSSSPRAQQHVNSSYESDSPKGFLKAQVPLSPPKGFQKAQAPAKRKKKVGSGAKPLTVAARGYARSKGEAVEEKEEPASSDVQELRLQGPVWEMGVPPLDDEVREWLQRIGLEKYAPVFQHHEVGDDVVPLLTMDDLKEMGINAVGARRKFFCEITKRKQALMLAEEPLMAEEK